MVRHGDADNDRQDVARKYLEKIRARRKQIYVVPGAGHEPVQASLERVRKVLLEAA